MASGISAKATVIPASISMRVLENQDSFSCSFNRKDPPVSVFNMHSNVLLSKKQMSDVQ